MESCFYNVFLVVHGIVVHPLVWKIKNNGFIINSKLQIQEYC